MARTRGGPAPGRPAPGERAAGPEDPPDVDEFLAFMTFASNGAIGCQCCDDPECSAARRGAGFSGAASARASAVPPAIRDAVDEYKVRKRKLEYPSAFGGSKRSYVARQNRELVKREEGFSVWRLGMPVSREEGDGCGDPIVEYRNNHRIIYVEHLNRETSHVLSTGKGIIGSAAEENIRKRVHWEAGSSYLLPCAKGIACGWIHKPNGHEDFRNSKDNESPDDDSKNRKGDDADGPLTATDAAADHVESSKNHNGIPTAKDAGVPKSTNDSAVKDVVIYSLKASPETLSSMEDKHLDEEGLSRWVGKSYKLFRRCLARLQQQTRSGGATPDEGKSEDGGVDVGMEGVLLPEEESAAVRLILELVK